MYTEFENFLFSNATFFAIFISAIVATIRYSAKSNIFKMWLFFLLGVFFHELMHFIGSVISFGFPYKFSIIPKKNEGNQYTMGHVTSFNVTWYNTFIINIAPIFLVPIAFGIYKYFFLYVDETILNFIIWIFLIVSLLFSSIPSSVDIKNILTGNILLNIFAGVVEITVLTILAYMYYLYM